MPIENPPSSPGPQSVAPSFPDQLNATRFAGWTAPMLRAFFEQAPFYAGTLAPDGRVTEAGRQALEACGYRREEVIGKFFWETPWWRASPEIQTQLRDALTGCLRGERFQAVWPYLFADGSEHWVDFSMSPVFENGALAYAIALGTDITARIRTEQELSAVRKRLDSALLASEIGTYEWDVVSNLLHCDHNLERLFGITLDASHAAPLEHFIEAIHVDDRERVIAHVQHSVATGENFEEDYRVVLPGGAQRWINSRGRMLKDERGRVVSFFGMVMDITRRKSAEQERQSMGDRLRRLTAIHETVLSATNDFAYVFDLQGRFIYANRALLTLYGRPLDGVAGRTFIELGYPQWHADMHLREIAQVIETRKPIRGEVPFRGESGISGIYDYIFTPVLGADGRVEAVAGTTRDVTDRKRVEARDRLLVALDDALRPQTDPQAITQAAAQLLGEYLGANRCAYADVEDDENTFNLTGDFNRDVPSIVGRYRFDQFGDECLRLMRAGEPFIVNDVETDPRTATGLGAYRATRIRAVICVPLKKAGRLVAAMAVHQDNIRSWRQTDIEAVQVVASRSWESIERTRVVRVLAESEQRLRLAVSTGRLGVWELEFPALTLTSSEQCKTIYGRSATDALTYAGMLATVHPEDRARVEDALARSIARGSEFDLEHRTRWPDGTTHWILVRGQTRLGGDRKPQRMIGVCLDITARKEAEHEQARLHAEAVRASRAKDDFLATLSHELRTPLNPVLLVASEAALDQKLDAATRESFETIRKHVELEARLIDDLLDLTAITRGKLAIRRSIRDLHEVVHRALEAVRPDFTQKHVSLETNLAASTPIVFVDDVRLLQVLINLLKNAAKFTPSGGRVELSSVLDGENHVRVRVADTGIGLTQTELERAFDAFEQGEHASESGSHRFGGLGLGLAIARQLVELHGGTLEGASAGRDRGATFTVTLPLRTGHPLPVALSHPVNSPPHAGAGRSVLLVEDHEPTRHALENLLRRRAYSVTSASSVAEARQQVGATRFDFVVSDLGLPDGDGVTLMRELRDQFGLTGIALTGYGMEEDVNRCRAAGFATHLTKPIRVETLDAALQELGAHLTPT